MKILVTLLRTPKVIKDGQRVIFPYRKSEGLFYYLCVKRSISRDEAVSIFWADCTESAARKNLRDAVYHLKRILGDGTIVNDGNNRISLNEEIDISTDYDQLYAQNLVDLYTGDFLEFFYIKNCLEFEEWAAEIRGNLISQYQEALKKRAAVLEKGRNSKALLECGQKLLQKNIYDESVYYDIIQALLRMGAYSEAEQFCRKLKTVFRQDLDVDPDERIIALMKEAALLRSARDEHKGRDVAEEYFYGREREIFALRAALVNQGTPAVLLTGEAGVGKTAILRKFQSGLQEKTNLILFYQCVQPEIDLYLKLWNDILAQVKECCNARGISSPSMLNMGGQFDASVYATQYEMFAKALLQTLLQDLKEQKVLIFIDDVQWMDKESRRLLSSLVFWAKGRNVIIVMTGRRESLTELISLLEAKGLLQEIKVPRFTQSETAEIVDECIPDLVERQDVVEKIYQQTGGNALFLTETLREIEHGGNSEQISTKMAGMIQSRLAGLSEDERETLNVISLFPRFATTEDLSVIMNKPKLDLLKNIEHLLSHQMIRLGTTYNKAGYGFSHQVIREYVYTAMISEKRQVLHSNIAEYYESKYASDGDIGLCPMLIYHFRCCGNTYKMYTYQLEYLKAFYAIQHEIYPYPSVQTEQSAMWQEMPRLSGEDALVELAEKVRALHGLSSEADSLRMKVEFLLGRYDLFSGSFEKGLKNIAASINIAKKLNDNRYLVDNYLQMAFHAIQIHDIEMLEHYISESENLIQKYPYTDTDVYMIMRLRGVYYMKTRQFDRAEEIFNRIIEHTEPLCKSAASYRVGLAACYNYLGESRQSTGDMDDALKYYLQAIECCESESSVRGIGVIYSHTGYILYTQGKFDLAQEYIDKANRCFAEHGALWGRSEALSYAALLAIERHQWKKAKELIGTAREIAQRGGNPEVLSLVQSASNLLEQRKAQKE